MKKLILTLLGILFLSAFSAFAQEFTLLTDGSKLADGMQFYIANTKASVALGPQNGSYRNSVSVTISNQVLTPGNNAELITLESANSDKWYLKTSDGKYLCATTTKNSLNCGTDKNSAYEATITIKADGTASIIFNGSGTVKTNYVDLRYNSSSPRFACYVTTTNMQAVQIYAATEVGPVKPTITLAFAETEGSVNVDETLPLPAVNATVSDDSTPELTYTYTSDNTEVATVENGIVTGVAAGTAKITATCAVDGYNVKDAEFTVTVVDPNATDETIIFANMGYSNQEVISTVTQGVVTLNFDKGSNSIDPKYFTNNKDVRLYGGGSLTISVEDGYYITKIESVYNNTQNTLSSDTGEFNSNYTTWTKTTNVNSVKFTESGTSGNRSWKQIKVYYEKAGDPTKTTPKLSFAETEVVEEFVEGKTLAVQVPTSDTEGLTYNY